MNDLMICVPRGPSTVTILDLMWTLTTSLLASFGVVKRMMSPLSGMLSVSSLCMYLILADLCSIGSEVGIFSEDLVYYQGSIRGLSEARPLVRLA